MSRQRMFRAKMKEPGNHEGFFAYLTGIGHDYWSSINGRYYGEIDSSTIGEWIGWEDKTGKSIYEGDLYKASDGYIYEICFDTFNAKFSARTKNTNWPQREDGYTYFDDNLKQIEVIGNIYEHKNLMP